MSDHTGLDPAAGVVEMYGTNFGEPAISFSPLFSVIARSVGRQLLEQAGNYMTAAGALMDTAGVATLGAMAANPPMALVTGEASGGTIPLAAAGSVVAGTGLIAAGQWLTMMSQSGPCPDPPGSSGTTSGAMRQLRQTGTTHVKNRQKAEQLFWENFFEGGFLNTTGWDGDWIRRVTGGNKKTNTYHWDELFEVLDDGVRWLKKHRRENPHGAKAHLQIHEEGNIFRVFFD